MRKGNFWNATPGLQKRKELGEYWQGEKIAGGAFPETSEGSGGWLPRELESASVQTFVALHGDD